MVGGSGSGNTRTHSRHRTLRIHLFLLNSRDVTQESPNVTGRVLPTALPSTPLSMLEAKLSEAGTFKKLLDCKDLWTRTRAESSKCNPVIAIKELVTDANFECNEEGINLQAMDNSHVALVSVLLQATGFKRYRCDRPMPLGVNLTSLTKVLKCAKDDDECTLKAADEADVLNLVYEAKCEGIHFFGVSYPLLSREH